MGKIANRLREKFRDQRTYYWIFAVVMVVPNLFLCYTEPLGFFAKVALVFVPAFIYMAFMLLFRRPGIPMLIFFPMYIFGALQLVLLYLFGNSIVATDMFLTIASTNSNEAFELLGKLLPSLIGVCVLYIPMIVLSVMSIRAEDRLTFSFRRHTAVIAFTVLFAGLGSMGLAKRSDDFYSAKFHIWPVNIFYNIQLAVEYHDNTDLYGETSDGFTFDAVSHRPDSIPEVYVMVIGETSRALNWQIYGYPRATNPLLSRTEGLVHFTDVLTQSNATYKSVPIIMSAASAEGYDLIFRQKSLIAAFREAGFRTAFLSNQMPNRSFVDFFAAEADTAYFLKQDRKKRDPGHEPFDSELLVMLDEELAREDGKKLILLHTYGSHFDYKERYDQSQRYFAPDDYTTIKWKEREKLMNAYDNTIRVVDRFLHEVIGRLSAMPAATAMLYISDHGEDLMDDRRGHFLHASPLPTYYQLHVPMLIWFSSEYDRLWPSLRANAAENVDKPMTSNVTFHTMLSIGGVETAYRSDSRSVVSDGFSVSTRHYLDDHNNPRMLDKIGLKALDVEMFNKVGIQYP